MRDAANILAPCLRVLFSLPEFILVRTAIMGPLVTVALNEVHIELLKNWPFKEGNLHMIQ
jgi:hypothetical protein